MLFPYKYVPHRMEKMHKFIEFIFYKVWCKAQTTEYSIELFRDEGIDESKDTLYIIMSHLFTLDLAGKLEKDGAAKFFYVAVNEIYNEFKQLSDTEMEEYKDYFESNNSIEKLCYNDLACKRVVYDELNSQKNSLNEKLELFFTKLYSSGFLGIKVVQEQLKVNLYDYYIHFVRSNDEGACPFCGLFPLDGEFDPTRDAYDHYLPKSKYPFNSINLKNLTPSCNKCNSGNKGSKDPLRNDNGEPQKAFYPFSEEPFNTGINITVISDDWEPLTPEKFSVEIISETYPEEVKTWDYLFRIKQRYAARCCSKNGGIQWLNRVLYEHENYGLTIQEMLRAEIKSSKNAKWQECNFLRQAFLEAFDRAGIFNTDQRLEDVLGDSET